MTRLARLLGAVVVVISTFVVASASAADAPTLAASARQISFGAPLTLRGSIPASAAGQSVDLLSQACGFTKPVTIATTTTGADGSYSFALQPTLNTTFLVQVAGLQSTRTTVTVQPLVQLRRVSVRTFEVNVSVGAGQFFTKKTLVQRYDARRKVWRTVASGALKQASDVGALVAVSAATLHATIARGSKIRAYVPAATLGSCYRPAASAAMQA